MTPAIARGLAALAIWSCTFPAIAQGSERLDELRTRALALVNEARDKAGLSTLRADAMLDDVAQGHATDMIAEDYYAHVAPDGTTPLDRFLAAGGSRWSLTGENIAMCSGCTPPADMSRVEAFQTGWMQSPDHRENILSEGFDRFGFGIAGEGDEIHAVQTFAGPGADDGGAPLDADSIRSAALKAVNARRGEHDLAPLEPSPALDTVAMRLREAVASDGALPDDLFGLLPADATGWTSMSVRSASRGGSGSALSSEEIEAFVEDWASSGAEAPFGGDGAGYLGFAAATQETGRATVVAVFGGRD